ncbi:hypothetical protein R1flu_028177 [Riccia fluitans]|uniref:BTB domain-containing protein n=1 Tax=Riccia fluitans TaxID=41844 RepID=A0ABD1XKZ0_9MARC
MFENSQTSKSKNQVISIYMASHLVVRVAIRYSYTAEISLTGEVPPNGVLTIASAYKIAHLQDTCEKELCSEIDEDNVLKMLKLSDRYELENSMRHQSST